MERRGGAAPFRILGTGAGAVLLVAGATGCYLSHSASTDARPSDAGTDADAADDARPPDDAGWPEAPDAQGPCVVEPHPEPFLGPAPELIWAGRDQPLPSYTQVCSTPIVVDLDPPESGVGRPEIVFLSYEAMPNVLEPPHRWGDDVAAIIFGDLRAGGGSEAVLRAIDTATGDSVFTFPSPGAGEIRWKLEATATPAAGDLDGDGLPEIVAIGDFVGTYALRSDGTLLWESPHPTYLARRIWTGAVAMSGAPAIADLDLDGVPEVVVGNVVLSGRDGGFLWQGEGDRGVHYGMGPIACVADLDEDGFSEVVAGPSVYGHDGALRWRAKARDGFCAVADVVTEVGAEGPEVVLVSGGYLRLLDRDDGEELWIQGVPGVATMFPVGGPPVVADFDGDGRAEIGVAHGDAYSVFDPDCTGNPLPKGCIDDGLRWTLATEDDSSRATGSSAFDFDGDGAAEVVYADEEFVRILRGSDGWEVFSVGNSSRTRTEYPIVADVDDDGNAELVFAANNEAFFLEVVYNAGLEVWGDRNDRWVGTRRIWNQHTYHVTNVAEDGSIQSPEEASWRGLNSYRQNMAEEPERLLDAVDLRVRAFFECTPEGDAELRIHVRNMGDAIAYPPIVVGIYDGRPDAGAERIGEVATTRRLGPGESEDLWFLWRDAPPSGDATRLWIEVDESEGTETGSVRECLEENNHFYLDDVGC